MTVAEKIKRSTKPLSYERANMSWGFAVKRKHLAFIGNYFLIVEAQFIDGSKLTCRWYW